MYTVNLWKINNQNISTKDSNFPKTIINMIMKNAYSKPPNDIIMIKMDSHFYLKMSCPNSITDIFRLNLLIQLSTSILRQISFFFLPRYVRYEGRDWGYPSTGWQKLQCIPLDCVCASTCGCQKWWREKRQRLLLHQ